MCFARCDINKVDSKSVLRLFSLNLLKVKTFLREVATKPSVKCVLKKKKSLKYGEFCSVLLSTEPCEEIITFLTDSSMDASHSVVLINFVPFV